MLDNIIGVEEAAKILGLSPGTVKNYCAEGKIEAKKIGKTWVIDKTKLEDWEMTYLVTAYQTEVYENNFGMEMTDRKIVDELEVKTSKTAESVAKRFYDEGADFIEIAILGGRDQAVRFHNPREGASPTGINWAPEFKAGLEV